MQHWKDQRPIETVVKQAGKSLPDVDALNAKVPQSQWEDGIDGEPRPPWQRQEIVYFLDELTAEKFTFASGTIGARIAIANLKDRVCCMRALRGENVVPVVELANKPMKTRFGGKLRPDLKIVAWLELGVGLTSEARPPQIEHAKPARSTQQVDRFAQAGQEQTADAKTRETKKRGRGIKPVKPPTLAEELERRPAPIRLIQK